MNSVILIGRLTRDPELRYIPQSQTAVASFTLAVDRPMAKEKTADFIRISVFGKQAENCSKYLSKGRQAAVEGRIQTGSYQNKNGETVYTTEVVANRVEFIGSSNGGGQSSYQGGYQNQGGYQGQGGFQGQGGYQGQGNAQPSYQNSVDDGNDPFPTTTGGSQMPPGFASLDDDDDIPF